jgi:hypothetical protein
MTIFIYFLKLTPMPVRVESFVADLDRWLCLYGHRDYLHNATSWLKTFLCE